MVVGGDEMRGEREEKCPSLVPLRADCKRETAELEGKELTKRRGNWRLSRCRLI